MSEIQTGLGNNFKHAKKNIIVMGSFSQIPARPVAPELVAHVNFITQ